MNAWWIAGLCLVTSFSWGQENTPIITTDTADSNFTKGPIVVCTITGMIEPGVQVLVERAVKEANDLDAVAIVFRVDTPGGRVDSAVEIASAISKAQCQSIAYIEGMGAISAGALISFACDDLIMAPGSNIGAATPVLMTSEGMTPAGEKSESFMRAKMRALAEENGHNADMAQAMVDKDIELRAFVNELGEYQVYAVADDGSEDDEETKSRVKPEIQDIVEDVIDNFTDRNLPDVIDEEPIEKEEGIAPGTIVYEDGSELMLAKGKLLTMTPKEAIKYGMIDRTAENLDDVVRHFLIEADEYHVVEPNWAEITFRFLTGPTIAGLLLMLGMGGLYLEVRTPGFGLPGIVGIVCLTLFFGSHFILGLADTIDLVLVLVGVTLLFIEAFIIPGFGIAGVSGIICLMLGTYLSLVNFTFPQYTWDFDRLDDVGQSFVVFLGSMTVFILGTWKLLPKTPFYREMIMSGTQPIEEGYTVQSAETAQAAIGLRGVASTMLRPAGKGRFNNQNYDIVTRGDFIDEGTPIVITQADGNRYVVELDKNGEES